MWSEEPRPSMQELVARLGDADFNAREAAQRDLLSAAGHDPVTLVEALPERHDDPEIEARCRVIRLIVLYQACLTLCGGDADLRWAVETLFAPILREERVQEIVRTIDGRVLVVAQEQAPEEHPVVRLGTVLPHLVEAGHGRQPLLAHAFLAILRSHTDPGVKSAVAIRPCPGDRSLPPVRSGGCPVGGNHGGRSARTPGVREPPG